MSGSDILKALAEQHYLETYTRKPEHYFDVYAAHFDPIREEPLSILELGIYSGASMLIWRDYFPNAKIVGLDIMTSPQRLNPHEAAGGMACIQGDQSNPSDLQRCLDQTPDGRFDVIIDDASHLGALSKASFDFLFVHGLKAGGLYFVEDYGASFMPQFDGKEWAPPPPSGLEDTVFPSHEHGMIAWLKQLIDELNMGQHLDPDHRTRLMASIHLWPSLALIKRP